MNSFLNRQLFRFCLLFVFIFGGFIRFSSVAQTAQTKVTCSSDSDCIGVDEVCNFQKLGAGGGQCLLGQCECKPCFGRNSTGQCTRFRLVKPCSKYCTQDECQNRCSRGNKAEIYPTNANCRLNPLVHQHNTRQTVKCNHCYEEFRGQCFKMSNLSLERNQPCATNPCGCATSLTCVGSCKCPTGYRWSQAESQCKKRIFGDSCQSDNDCLFVLGRSVCTSNICQCESPHNPVRINFVDRSTKQLKNYTICADGKFQSDITIGNRCDVTFHLVNRTTGFCQGNSICFSCANRIDLDSDMGLCRSFTGITRNTSNCRQLPLESTTAKQQQQGFGNLERRNNKVGALCTSDNECSTNEECRFEPVEPKCSVGVCRCKPCHDLTTFDSYCQPFQTKNLGDVCDESLKSVKYPKGSFCNSSQVVCYDGLEESNNECIEISNNLPIVAGLGATCLKEDDCGGGKLICDISNPTCDCYAPHGFGSFWDSSSERCTRGEQEQQPCFKCPEDEPTAACRIKAPPPPLGDNDDPYQQCFTQDERLNPVCDNQKALDLCSSNEDCGIGGKCSCAVGNDERICVPHNIQEECRPQQQLV